MIRVTKHSFLVVGVIVLVAGAGKALAEPKKVFDPKVIVDPKKVIDPKLSKVIADPKLVVDPKKVVNPKFLIDAKVVNGKAVIDPKVSKIIVDPKGVVDPKITKVIIDPKIGVDPKVVNPKFSKVIVDPKYSKVVDPKFSKVIVDPKYSKVIVDPKFSKVVVDPKFSKVVVNPKVTTVIVNPQYTKVIVTKVVVVQGTYYPPVVVLPFVGGVYFREIAEYLGVEVPVVAVQQERFLRLHNDSAEQMTVYLRNHTADVTGEWDWFPEPPSPEAAKWFSFVLEPGEVLEPKLGNLPMAANRIRLIVETGMERRETFKETDFWLVPEATPMGEHLYYSEARQTFQLYLNSIK